MFRYLSLLIPLLFPLLLFAYTPPAEIAGPVKSVRSFRVLLRDVPAGSPEEPWLANIDYDSRERPVTQWFYDRGVESRRHEFRYERDGTGRERTVWVTYVITPDLRPPGERLAGYEHWYTLEGEPDRQRETRFETVESHGVKSVFRYYDGEGRLVHESDSLADLDVSIAFDSRGRLSSKKGTRGDRVFWEETYYYDEKDRLVTYIQSDLNRQLYTRGDYEYGEGRVVFTRFLPDKPVSSPLAAPPADRAVFRSIKEYDGEGRLVRLSNYNDDGPPGMILTEELLYSYNGENRISRVTEPNRRRTWDLTYDDRGNWISLEERDELNSPGESLRWRRVITYYE